MKKLLRIQLGVMNSIKSTQRVPQRILDFMYFSIVTTVFITVVFATLGCSTIGKNGQKDKNPVFYALAVMNPTAGNAVSGKVWFSEGFGKVKVDLDLQGLDANTKHGFHIHEFGDCTALDAASAGGHFNPGGHEHGSTNGDAHHAGDLGNIQADKLGRAKYSFEVPKLSLQDGAYAILGRGLVIHKNPDDLMTQPTGGSGPRVACGVIGAATK